MTYDLMGLLYWEEGQELKDFSEMAPDDKYVLRCPVCGRAGMYSHTPARETWDHVKQRDLTSGYIGAVDYCEVRSDGSELRNRPEEPKYTISIHGGDRAMHAQRQAVARSADAMTYPDAVNFAREMLLVGEHMCLWEEEMDAPSYRFAMGDEGGLHEIHA